MDTPPIISPWTYSATIVNVLDGDTIEVNIDLGFGVWLIGQRVRMLEVHAPEVTRPSGAKEEREGQLMKMFLASVLPLNLKVVLISRLNKKDKYGRWLADIWKGSVKVNTLLNNWMTEKGIQPGK